MDETLNYSDFQDETSRVPIVDELERQLQKSEELKLVRAQQFLELEIVRAGVVQAILDAHEEVPLYTARFFPHLHVNKKGDEQYYVIAEWPHGIGYLPTMETQRMVRVGRQLRGEIIEEDDFTIDQVLLVVSQIHYLRKKRKQGKLPNLDKHCSGIAA